MFLPIIAPVSDYQAFSGSGFQSSNYTNSSIFIFLFSHFTLSCFPTAISEGTSAIPDIELQCRVVKRWPALSSLILEVIPWCLVINNSSCDLYIRDVTRDLVLNISKREVVAPHRFQVVQFHLVFLLALIKIQPLKRV